MGTAYVSARKRRRCTSTTRISRDVRRGSWVVKRRGAVDSRGCTTPPALKSANYLTIRALSYAVSLVCRPPACFWTVTFEPVPAMEGLYSLKKDGRVVVDAAVRVVWGIVILLT